MGSNAELEPILILVVISFRGCSVKYKGLFLSLLMVVVSVLMGGCQGGVDKEEFFTRYDLTTLKVSSSADVLSVIKDPAKDYVSQSDSVVAAWGNNRKESVIWFNAVAFDEDELVAVRKYALVADEVVKSYYIKPAQRLRFDADIVMDIDVLDAAYANENERRIEILRESMRVFRVDMAELISDGKTLQSGVMATKQALNGILSQLEQSPAKAVRLTDIKGLEFMHISLGPGRVQLLFDDDVVKIRIKVGRGWFYRTTGFKIPMIEREVAPEN